MSDITQEKLREGDPVALAALCARRGPAVLAYCEQVAGRERALIAACDAFAWFRVAVSGPGEVKAREAEVLLRSMTRRAATAGGVRTVARHELGALNGACADCETRLVYYVEDGVSDEERRQIAAHMAGCEPCVEALERLHAGEDAYDRPPAASLAGPAAVAVIEELIAASPVRAHAGDVGVVRATALGLLNGERPNGAKPTFRASRPARPESPERPEQRSSAAPTERRPEQRPVAAPGERRPAHPAPPAQPSRRPTQPPPQRPRDSRPQAPVAPSTARAPHVPPSRTDQRTGRRSPKSPPPKLTLAALPRLVPVALSKMRRWRYKTALSQRRRPRWYNGRSAVWWLLCFLLVVILGLAVVAATAPAHAAYPTVRGADVFAGYALVASCGCRALQGTAASTCAESDRSIPSWAGRPSS